MSKIKKSNNKIEKRNCGYCKSSFKPNSKKQVCCSSVCNQKKWIKLNPDKQKAINRRRERKRKGINRYNSEARKKWYKKRKKDKVWADKIKKQANVRKRKILDYLKEYKISNGCCDCGYNKHHAALDFDHVRGIKKINVSFAKSIKQAQNEIKKCEIVCSNCHRVRTFNRIHKIKK